MIEVKTFFDPVYDRFPSTVYLNAKVEETLTQEAYGIFGIAPEDAEIELSGRQTRENNPGVTEFHFEFSKTYLKDVTDYAEFDFAFDNKSGELLGVKYDVHSFNREIVLKLNNFIKFIIGFQKTETLKLFLRKADTVKNGEQ